MKMSRRAAIQTIGNASIAAALYLSGCSTPRMGPLAGASQDRTVEEWMNAWMTDNRFPVGALHVFRFAEPIYVLTKPIAWKPNPGQEKFAAVEVPTGFVTDFASIPRAFWSALRPDGKYTYAAIVHDYLYWTQTRPRDEADTILKMGMEDFEINSFTIAAIYQGVRVGGGAAWDGNAKLKQEGERRILRRLPEDPRTTWAEWKKLPDVFSD
jgi:hypothetical protein